MKKTFRTTSGFTLIELLLSVALVAILAGFSIGMYYSYYVQNDLNIATHTLAQGLRRAQVLSRAMQNDSSWGIKTGTGSTTIFKGSSYSGRDTAYDEVFDLPSSVSVTGVTEVVYSKFDGIPGTTGTMTVSSNNNESITLTLNAKGMVSY